MNFASIDLGLFGLLGAPVGLFVLMLVLPFVGVFVFPVRSSEPGPAVV
ncbi:hypothetical protein PAMC26577_34385 [Caballeronia sordidicola]|uniref:Uncharacterized protein n=1 Tax=Caballeronia sordidicola TaxID=196367 RepID=A0A242MA78_CABSO|nr:hypothetical protein PAMC26577_34385 [Caballeronia sordidicola]